MRGVRAAGRGVWLTGPMALAARRAALVASVTGILRAIEQGDDAAVETIMRASRSRRALAPLAFAVGAFAMLFDGLKLLVTNWRLMLIMILPAVWIWLAMYDLKAHVLHGKSFHVLRGPILIPIVLAITAITAGGFFLNAVFAFAIAGSRPPTVRPAFAQARRQVVPILVSGVVVGLLLAFSTTIVTRWGRPWFTLSLGVVVGVMMVSYVAVPSRLIGMKAAYSRRDKVTASLLGSAIGATVCTPPYVLGRVGLLMLGSRALLIPGIFVMAIGFGLQAGATGAVRAIKMSAALTAGVAHPGTGTADAVDTPS